MIDKIIELITQDKTVRTATYYETPKRVIRVTRRLKPRARFTRNEFVVTIGTPNYLAVEFIKKCIEAKEPFPVKKIQLGFYSKRKK